MFIVNLFTLAYLLSGCPCPDATKAWEEVYAQSQVVLVGKLVAVAPEKKQLEIEKGRYVTFERLTFEVERFIKEDALSKTMYEVINEVSDCGEKLEKGKRYLVAAYRAAMFDVPRLHKCFAPVISSDDKNFDTVINILGSVSKP